MPDGSAVSLDTKVFKTDCSYDEEGYFQGPPDPHECLRVRQRLLFSPSSQSRTPSFTLLRPCRPLLIE